MCWDFRTFRSRKLLAMVVQMRVWYTSEVSWAPEPSYPQKDGPLELFLSTRSA